LSCHYCRLRLKCDGTCAETRFCLSAKRTSPFKSAGASVQSTAGNRGVRISGSNVGYTTFRGSEGYWLPTPFTSFPFTSPPVRHRVPSHFNWTLLSVSPLMSPDFSQQYDCSISTSFSSKLRGNCPCILFLLFSPLCCSSFLWFLSVLLS